MSRFANIATKTSVAGSANGCGKPVNILGLKQEEVAHLSQDPANRATDIESGQRRVEAIELTRLAKLYRQPVGYFTGEDEAAASLPVDVAHLARRAAALSQQDRDELGRFADISPRPCRTRRPG